MQAGGRRRSTADGYLRPAAHRPNLVVRHGAAVHKVEIVDGRAEGVRYSVDGRPVTVTARREVILCAGAVDSPRLLMVSGIGPADRLRDHGIELVADAPEVGRNLRDHLAAMLLVEAAEPGPDPRRAPGRSRSSARTAAVRSPPTSARRTRSCAATWRCRTRTSNWCC